MWLTHSLPSLPPLFPAVCPAAHCETTSQTHQSTVCLPLTPKVGPSTFSLSLAPYVAQNEPEQFRKGDIKSAANEWAKSASPFFYNEAARNLLLIKPDSNEVTERADHKIPFGRVRVTNYPGNTGLALNNHNCSLYRQSRPHPPHFFKKKIRSRDGADVVAVGQTRNQSLSGVNTEVLLCICLQPHLLSVALSDLPADTGHTYSQLGEIFTSKRFSSSPSGGRFRNDVWSVARDNISFQPPPSSSPRSPLPRSHQRGVNMQQ